MNTVLDRISKALGRTEPLRNPPTPPKIDEAYARLVRPDVSLPDLFVQRAREMKMTMDRVSSEELMPKLIEVLKSNQCHSIALPVSPLFGRLGIVENLKSAGFDAHRWDEMTLDGLYEFDCGVTDVTYAVAETGSLVIRSSPEHGRSISLVPGIHVAVVEEKNIVADLMDLFEALAADRDLTNITLITGPSKTSDIEMTLVVGVHGPCKVYVFLLA